MRIRLAVVQNLHACFSADGVNTTKDAQSKLGWFIMCI